MAPSEVTLLRSLPWLALGLMSVISARLLRNRLEAVPLITIFTASLSAMLALVLVATLTVAPLTSTEWYQGSGLSAVGRLIAAGVSLTLLLTAGISIVAIAGAGALGYRPSLSYLQLLSAADAGMATAGTAIGLGWAFGPIGSAVGGASMAAVCVWSIWRYLSHVGFGPQGGWRVNREALWRYVYPYDIAALLVVIFSLAGGAMLHLR
jgi:hypothetical protein